MDLLERDTDRQGQEVRIVVSRLRSERKRERFERTCHLAAPLGPSLRVRGGAGWHLHAQEVCQALTLKSGRPIY